MSADARRSRLRVAVPAHVARLDGTSGHGRMWSEVLPRLRERVKVDIRDPAGRAPRMRRPDVWLLDGHAGPPFDAIGSTPVVAHVHEASWAEPELAGFLDPDFAREMASRTEATLALAAHVITLSEFTGDQVAAASDLPRERVHAVLLGVDGEAFRPGLDGGAAAVTAALGEERPYVLFVGVIHPRKNVDAVRAAVAALAGRGFEHALAIVGADPADRRDGSDLVRAAREELPGAAGRLAWIERPGEGDLARLFAGAAAFCLPSFSEGFGLPALEAMSAGAPVVAARRGALPEVVGDAGVLVEPTADEVEQALARVLTDPALATRLAAAGRERAEELTWERTADGWLAVLKLAAE